MPKTLYPGKAQKVYALRVIETGKFIKKHDSYGSYSLSDNPCCWNSNKTCAPARKMAAKYFSMKEAEIEMVEFEITARETATYPPRGPSKLESINLLRRVLGDTYSEALPTNEAEKIWSILKSLKPISAGSSLHIIDHTYEYEGKKYEVLWEIGGSETPLSVSLILQRDWDKAMRK